MYNFYFEKVMAGFMAACIGALTDNLIVLFIFVAIFETVDFVTGCWRSAVESHRRQERFAFESIKAWRTIYKVVFILVGIVLSEILDAMICENRLRLANIFTAFACGVEFWSFLENAAVISDHPIFRWLRKFMQNKVERELNINNQDNGNDKQEL